MYANHTFPRDKMERALNWETEDLGSRPISTIYSFSLAVTLKSLIRFSKLNYEILQLCIKVGETYNSYVLTIKT